MVVPLGRGGGVKGSVIKEIEHYLRRPLSSKRGGGLNGKATTKECFFAASLNEGWENTNLVYLKNVKITSWKLGCVSNGIKILIPFIPYTGLIAVYR